MASAFQESHGKDAVGKSGKVKVTILASEWGSSNGGLSTLNRELAIWLAKSSDVEISFFVPQCSEKDKTEALRHNISIVEASPLIGFGKLELLSFPPDDLQIEVVVGHGVILGRQAQVIRRNRKCKWVQVMHTDSEEMGMFKSYPDPISRNEKKHNDEVGLCEKADFVVGIGPKLAEAFHSYLRFCKNDWTIFDFTPGIFEEFRSVQQVSKEVNHRSVLVFGRGDVEDFKLKGFDIAGKAISSLVDTILVFVGAPDGKHEEVKEFFTLSGLPGRRLRVREYTESREQLKKLFCEVDLVLMPSRTDGFGLTGLEALSAGLPVLVSKNSGFGEALCNVPHCSHFVIDSDNPDVWAAAIKNIIWDKNRQCRLEQAKKVRKSYHEKYSWTKQSDALRSKIVKLARACLQLQIDGVPIPKASAQKGTETEVHSSDRQVIQEVRVPSTTKKQEVLNKIMEMYLRNIDPLNSEQWNGFVCFLQEVHQLMILCADSGSLRITVEVCSKATLEELWKDYRSGHLNQVAQEFLVTEELLEEFGLIYFELTTFIAEGEYKTCQHYFSGNIASRRINADNIAIPLCLPNNCRWNAATGYYDKTGEQRRSLYVFESALRKLRTVKGNIASRRITANDIAIPLCLPNNCRWNAATGYYDKTGEQRRSLYVVEPALRKLRTVKGPVCVVSIAGQYRRGKSYILAEAFDQPDVFPLGHHFEPETMGIWMWIVPQKFQLSNGQECTVVLLDSEGIDTVVGEGLDDHQIFTLTVLLSSVMIYNSTGAPTRHDLDGLDFIVKLSERIKLRSSNDGKPSMRACRKDTEFFHKTFPFFMWLLRDVVKSIPPDCDNIKEYILTRVFKDQRQSVGDNAQKVAESILRFFPGFQAFSLRPPSDDEELLRNMNSNKSRLNPRFLSGLKQFKQLLRSVLIPKYSPNDGEIVTGEGLAALVQLYVDAINTPGVIPNVQTAWETFVMTKCSEACQASLKIYDATMNAELSGKLPCDSDFIRVKHELALQKGVALLEKETFGISATTTEKYRKKLTGSFDEKLGWWQLENGKLTRAACDSLLKKLKKEHLDPVLSRLGKEGAKMSFDDIQQGYKRIEQDFKASAKGAKDVCAEVFYEFHPLLMEEMKQYFGVLQQLKDFDEKKSLEMAARAYQEQEMKKLEEQHARLEQENRERQKDMEKQQSKFEEEWKRLQKQRAEDAKVQQEQMENMIKASMQRAEQDRKEFIRENQGLNARLEEMKRLNQERQMEIARLNQQIHQNMSQQQEARKPGFFDKALQMVTGVSSLIAAGAGLAAAVPKCNVM